MIRLSGKPIDSVLVSFCAGAVWLGVVTWGCTTCSAAGTDADFAGKILDATGVRGGLVVHIGCGDGQLTAALRAGESFVVHGLDADPAKVASTRRHLRAEGIYGSVSVDRLTGGRLPYTDNLVNLVVSQGLGNVSREEVMRVLAPGGVAYLKSDDKWTSTVKPRPAEIAEWTHFLCDPTNNAVSNDSVVGPPRQLQWVGGPKWARSHDHLGSVSAAVSSAGRVFYIVDEGPTAAIVLEPQWRLVARDAFSGVVLWKRPIANWQWHLRGFRSGPSDLARRLVADGDRVYVTLDIDGPLCALDAATGETVMTYEGTGGTREVLSCEGTLFLVAGNTAVQEAAEKAVRRGRRPGFSEVRPQRPAYPEIPPVKRILAVDAEKGRMLWEKADEDTAELMPATLAVSAGRVFAQNADNILCLDTKSGKEVWRAQRPVSRSRPTWTAPTLVVYGDVVLSADRAVAQKAVTDGGDGRKVNWVVSSAGGQAPVGELIAFSAVDGSRLWSSEAKECYNAPVDVLVAGGLVWTGKLVRANEPGITEGRDPKTGQVKRTRPNDQQTFAPGMGHGRCYRNKGTDRYLILGRSGVEFLDVATGDIVPNHWTRGTCQYGVMPCNGLVYVPPHSCACFIRSKLNAFNCFAPRRAEPAPILNERSRLERGPAYDQVAAPDSTSDQSAADQWATYRHDAARSGCTPSPVPTALKRAWQTKLGGKLSPIVVAAGKLFVAQVDAHTVHALSAADGSPLWSYTAAGRVDSPPTVWQGRVLFGSADGWVYCVRASDGALVWRYRVAAADQSIMAFGQVESAWPVHGSVLVCEGKVYCAAGRSSYLDGGIRLCCLDAESGRLLAETVVDHRDPKTGHQPKGSVRGTNMPGALPDVLSSDGQSLFMRHARFDLQLQPQPSDVPHLFSAAGFLDDSWWHRTYWMIGTLMGTNYGGWPNPGNRVPAGRMLVFDDSSVYGFGRSQYIHHGAHVGLDGATVYHFRAGSDTARRFTHYRLFAAGKTPAGTPPTPGKVAPNKRKRPAQPRIQHRWQGKIPVLARAMVLAGKTLFVAGPPDVFAEDDPLAALEGRKGGTLLMVAAADGTELARLDLESPPVFDGMAAASGQLYMATTDGHVLCLGGVD
jgi:outer membrane protein assembly factor BamB